MTYLLKLLAEKHRKDVFVSECKDGPTQYGTHRRMDAWVMKRSWASPLTTAYEIKMSRNDFLRDDKWPAYIPYCNQLYFVCPSGLIKPEEVGESCGLIWASKTKTRLYTKRKAPHRELEVPESVYRYILMCRTKIVSGNMLESTESGAGHWQRWLEEKDDWARLGRLVSGKLQRLYRQNVEKVDRENLDLQGKIKGLERTQLALDAMGMDLKKIGYWNTRNQIKKRAEEMAGVVPADAVRALRRVIRDMDQMADRLEEMTP